MSALRLLTAGREAVEAVRGDLLAAGAPPELVERHLSSVQTFRHGEVPPSRDGKPAGKPGERELQVTAGPEHYDLVRAHDAFFSIRDWQRIVISVHGALHVRLEDQRKIGRQRRGGERSPAPLPDWYELTHLVYEHGPELGLDPTRPTYQYLPGTGDEYLNIAEALHLRQPR